METTRPSSAPSASSPTPVEHLSTSEAWSLLRASVVGRLAVVHEDGPDIFPVNFAVDHGTVVIRTAAGTKYDAALASRVAFEVDGYDLESARAWSVVMRGHASEVHDVDEVISVLGIPLLPWHAGAKPHLLRLVPDAVTGRRFEVTGGARSGRGGV